MDSPAPAEEAQPQPQPQPGSTPEASPAPTAEPSSLQPLPETTEETGNPTKAEVSSTEPATTSSNAEASEPAPPPPAPAPAASAPSSGREEASQEVSSGPSVEPPVTTSVLEEKPTDAPSTGAGPIVEPSIATPSPEPSVEPPAAQPSSAKEPPAPGAPAAQTAPPAAAAGPVAEPPIVPPIQLPPPGAGVSGEPLLEASTGSAAATRTATSPPAPPPATAAQTAPATPAAPASAAPAASTAPAAPAALATESHPTSEPGPCMELSPTGQFKALPAGDWPGGGPPSARDRAEREDRAKADTALSSARLRAESPSGDLGTAAAAAAAAAAPSTEAALAGPSPDARTSTNNWENARFGSTIIGNSNNSNSSNNNRNSNTSNSIFGVGSGLGNGSGTLMFGYTSGGEKAPPVQVGISATDLLMDPWGSDFSKTFLEGLDANSKVPIEEDDELQKALDATMQLQRKENTLSREAVRGEDDFPSTPASVALLMGEPAGPPLCSGPSSPSSPLAGEDDLLMMGATTSQTSMRSASPGTGGGGRGTRPSIAALSLGRAGSKSLSPSPSTNSKSPPQRARSAGPGGGLARSTSTTASPLQSQLQSQLERAKSKQALKKTPSTASRSISPAISNANIEPKSSQKRATLMLDVGPTASVGSRSPTPTRSGSAVPGAFGPEASLKSQTSLAARRSLASVASRPSQPASPSSARASALVSGATMSNLLSSRSKGGDEEANLDEGDEDDENHFTTLTSTGSGVGKGTKGRMSISKIATLTKWAIKAKAAAAAAGGSDAGPRKSMQERRSLAMTADLSQYSQGPRMSTATGLGADEMKARGSRVSRLSMINDILGQEETPAPPSDDEGSTQRELGENRYLPQSLVLCGFSRAQLNGRYWRHNGMKDMVNDKEIYLSESNKNALLYYCRSQNDWRITNNRASAMKGMGLARACKGVDILNASVGSDWQEWDKDVGKWVKRPNAGVQEMEMHADVSFSLEEKEREDLEDDKETLVRLYEAIRMVVAEEAQTDEDSEDIEVTVDLETGKVQAKVVPLDLSNLRSGQILERLSTHFPAFREEVRGAVQMALRGTELSAKILKKESEEQAAAAEKAAEAAKKAAAEEKEKNPFGHYGVGALGFGLPNSSAKAAPAPPPAQPPARSEPIPKDIKLFDFFVGHRDGWMMQLSSINPLSETVVADASPPSPRTLQATRPSSTASLRAEAGFQQTLKLSSSTPTLRGVPGMSSSRGRGWGPSPSSSATKLHGPSNAISGPRNPSQSRSISPGNCSTCTSLGLGRSSSRLGLGLGPGGGGASSSLSVFKAFLLTRLTSYAVAWRTLLDPSHTGYLLKRDFFKLSRQLHFHGNMKDVWEEMDADNLGRVRLDNLDFDTASLLGKFLSVLESRYGSLGDATEALGLSNNRRLLREEFMQKLQGSVLAGRDTSLRLFDMLAESIRFERSGTARKQAAVTSSSLLWLGKIGPWLPKPAQRIRPGAADGLDRDVDDDGELERIIGMYSDSEDSVHGGVCGGNEIAPRSRRHGKDVFQDLAEQAIGYHCRREMLDRQSKKKPGQVSKGRIQNPEHLEGLHFDHSRRIAKQNVLTQHLENSLRAIRRRGEHGHDPAIFDRLITPRPDVPAKGLGGKDLTSSTFKPAPSQKKPAEEIEKEVSRLYRDASLRKTRHEELVALRTKQAEEELAAKQPKPRHTDGTVNKAQMVRRLHDLEVTKRQQKTLGRHQEAQKVEDEIVAQASSVWLSSPPKSPDSTPRRARSTESAHRLHLDSYVRKETVNRKRKAKREEERQELDDNSIHQWSPFHTGDVFKRLFTSYGRHIGPDGIDRTRWGQDSTWQEPLQPDHPDYLPDDGPWNDKTRANARPRPSTAFAGIRFLCGPRLDDPEATPFEEVVHPDVAEFAKAKAGCIRGLRDRRARDAVEEEEELERQRDEATEKSLSRLTFKSPIMSRRSSFQMTETESSVAESFGEVEELTEFTLVGDTLTIGGGNGSDIYTSQSTLGLPHPASARQGHTSSMSTINTTGTGAPARPGPAGSGPAAPGALKKAGKPALPAGLTTPVSALKGARVGVAVPGRR